ncbi:MAG TPA: sigma-70 family RNA polymerase sigma factor [Gemmataceae bacterium]|nr:sigma-70 family RNA polymerase sigma factor [Gemmataceae bacterium]
MSPSEPNPRSDPPAAGQFLTTHWSMVVAAQDRAAPQAREALAALCRTYWYPLYAFIRRQGFEADQAQDLTQEFFTRLLEKDFLQVVDPQKGKFRSFLLAACKHFLANERDRARAQKRGGGCSILSVDFDSADSRYRRELADNLTPERLFERRWALALLERVLARLREEFHGAGKGRLFERLKVTLTGEKSPTAYRQMAAELGTTEGAVKVAMHRLRQRYRELLREEIAQTVSGLEQVEEEVRELFTALGS